VSSTSNNAPWEFPLPPGWKREQLKYNSYLKGRLGWQNLRADEYTRDGPYLVTSEHFVDDRIDWDRCYHVSADRYEMAPQIQLQSGDVLVMKDGAAMGKLAYVDELPGPACLNSHLLLLRPINGPYQSRLLYYVLGSPLFRAYMERERTGSTFLGISQESIASFPFTFPSLAFQEQIVSFLDRETAKIDALIAKKQRLIELLQEKRTALISHAVTKGLDPNVVLKDTGIDRIRQVPEHWGIKPLGRVVTIVGGSTPSKDRPEFWGGEIPWVSPKDIKKWVLDDSEDHITTYALRECRIRLLLDPAVLIVVRGMILARDFPVAVNKAAVTINQDMKALVPHRDISPYFLAHQLRAIQDVFFSVREESAHGTKCLRTELWKNIEVAIPPVEEQKEICHQIERKTAVIDVLILKH